MRGEESYDQVGKADAQASADSTGSAIVGESIIAKDLGNPAVLLEVRHKGRIHRYPQTSGECVHTVDPLVREERATVLINTRGASDQLFGNN